MNRGAALLLLFPPAHVAITVALRAIIFPATGWRRQFFFLASSPPGRGPKDDPGECRSFLPAHRP